MNLHINHIPENWNPECTKSFNRWISKVYRHVKKSKL